LVIEACAAAMRATIPPSVGRLRLRDRRARSGHDVPAPGRHPRDPGADKL